MTAQRRKELLLAWLVFVRAFNAYLCERGLPTVDYDPDQKRDKNGKFAREGGGKDAEYGEAFPQFKGKPKKAIEHLLKVRRGYVPGAFYRKDLGHIDLVWGNRHFGLRHIEKRRLETGQDFKALMKDLPEIIEKGELLDDGENKDMKIIMHKGKRAIIKLIWEPKYGKRTDRNWLFTAYYEY